MNKTTFDELYQMYIVEGKSMGKISKELGIAVGKIHRLIHEYGIKAKSRGDYPVTEKQREASRQNGIKAGSMHPSEESKAKMSKAKKKYFDAPGHTKIRVDGYKYLYYPDYPHSTKDGYVMEHVYIMEQHIGRLLNDNECVHHINFDRADNRIENLKVMTKSEHMSYHARLRYAKKRGDDLSIFISYTAD